MLVLGAFLLSPLADVLPVDLLGAVASLFGSGSGHVYFRVVPEQPGHLSIFVVVGIVLMAIGLVSVVVGRLSRP